MTDEEKLCRMIAFMDKLEVPHNCNGHDLILIDGTYSIKIDKRTTPWCCSLYKNDEKLFCSNPTGIVLLANAVLKNGGH